MDSLLWLLPNNNVNNIDLHQQGVPYFRDGTTEHIVDHRVSKTILSEPTRFKLKAPTT